MKKYIILCFSLSLPILSTGQFKDVVRTSVEHDELESVTKIPEIPTFNRKEITGV